jgi:hypothetical protein
MAVGWSLIAPPAARSPPQCCCPGCPRHAQCAALRMEDPPRLVGIAIKRAFCDSLPEILGSGESIDHLSIAQPLPAPYLRLSRPVNACQILKFTHACRKAGLDATTFRRAFQTQLHFGFKNCVKYSKELNFEAFILTARCVVHPVARRKRTREPGPSTQVMAERWLAMHATNASRYPRASQDTHMTASIDAEENRTPPSVRRNASMRASVLEGQNDGSPGRSDYGVRNGNERLYEAYNDLHALAQDFEKPFDAPAILVVGHQTDGKSGE